MIHVPMKEGATNFSRGLTSVWWYVQEEIARIPKHFVNGLVFSWDLPRTNVN